jgi:hypothetical protein
LVLPIAAGHLTLIISPPLPTIYDFHPSQVPLLVRLLALTRTLLDRHSLALPLSAQPSRRSSRDGLGPPPSPMESTLSLAPSSPTLALPSPTSFPPRAPGGRSRLQERIGFVVSPFSASAAAHICLCEAIDADAHCLSRPEDPLNAGQPNLTLHAMLGPLDRASFWTRAGALGPLGFYSLDDLIAEIRCAHKSLYWPVYEPRADLLPDAAASRRATTASSRASSTGHQRRRQLPHRRSATSGQSTRPSAPAHDMARPTASSTTSRRWHRQRRTRLRRRQPDLLRRRGVRRSWLDRIGMSRTTATSRTSRSTRGRSASTRPRRSPAAWCCRPGQEGERRLAYRTTPVYTRPTRLNS